MRYARGEIWWYQNRDDLALIDQKIEDCRTTAANSDRYGRKLGCFIQRQKLGMKRLAIAVGKSFVRFFVDGYVGQRDALEGSNAVLATLKIITVVGILVFGTVEIIRNRVAIADYCQGRYDKLHAYLFPPSPAVPPAPKEYDIYISTATSQALAEEREERERARSAAAAAVTTDPPEPTVMSRDEPPTPLLRDLGSDEPGDGPCTGFGGNLSPSPRILTQQWNAARNNNAGRALDDELPTTDNNVAAEPEYLDLGPEPDRIEPPQSQVPYRRNSSPEHVHAEPAESTMAYSAPQSQSFGNKKRVAFKDDPIDRPAAPAAVTRSSLSTGLPRRSPTVSPTRTGYDQSGRPLGPRAAGRLPVGTRARPGSATEGVGRRPTY